MRNVSYLKLKLLEKTDALSSRFKGAEEVYEKLKKINSSRFLSPEDKDFFPNFSFTKEQMREIYYAALLHDIGKIGVREHVLNKATKLSSSRMKIIYLTDLTQNPKRC